MGEEPLLLTAVPIKHRDLPTLPEALQENPADGPRPLTIAEYRARQEKSAPKKHKRSGKRIKLLHQRRLVKEMTQLAKDEASRQRYKERLEDIENKLCKEPITSIPGGPEIYIDLGSTVNLTCVIKHLPDPPASVQWNHNNQEINYDSPRGGVSVITEKGDITTSYLLIQRASIADSGKYSCLPSNANPKSVNVHILKGDHPAAVQKSHILASETLNMYFLQILLNLLVL
ncbi:uncharacterized protein LOC120457482 isoform X3 [Drosophila santomea]|uniref:uncharacterized protein LOC120457482 isoform X3 n=1 Tax=Drosophila santomea TaxID=129105 RepID=UPI001953A2DC|nr:uncharacterized protein LOC120457482 isoform X3 [Drosophila santomea]